MSDDDQPTLWETPEPTKAERVLTEDGRTVLVSVELFDQMEEELARLRAENSRLLDDPGRNAIGKFTRRSEESRMAALRAMPKTGTKRARILALLVVRHPDPLSDEQIHDVVGGDIRSVNARRKELEEGGWVVKSTVRWNAPSGNRVSTWTLSPTAVEVLTDAPTY